MKSLRIALLLILTAASSFAAANFSGLEGTYKGKYSFNYTGSSFSGTLVAVVTVSENGNRLQLELYGPISFMGQTIASYGKLKLLPNRKVSTNSVLFGYYVLLPDKSKFSGSKKTFKFTVASTGLANATMTYRLKFTGKGVVLSGKGPLSGSTLTINFKGTKKE